MQRMSDTVNHHLGVLQLAEDLRCEREKCAAQQGSGARMQTADDGHGKERQRYGEREGFSAKMPVPVGNQIRT